MLEVGLAVVDTSEGGIVAQAEDLVALTAAEARLVEDLLIGRDLVHGVDGLLADKALGSVASKLDSSLGLLLSRSRNSSRLSLLGRGDVGGLGLERLRLLLLNLGLFSSGSGFLFGLLGSGFLLGLLGSGLLLGLLGSGFLLGLLGSGFLLGLLGSGLLLGLLGNGSSMCSLLLGLLGNGSSMCSLLLGLLGSSLLLSGLGSGGALLSGLGSSSLLLSSDGLLLGLRGSGSSCFFSNLGSSSLFLGNFGRDGSLFFGLLGSSGLFLSSDGLLLRNRGSSGNLLLCQLGRLLSLLLGLELVLVLLLRLLVGGLQGFLLERKKKKKKLLALTEGDTETCLRSLLAGLLGIGLGLLRKDFLDGLGIVQARLIDLTAQKKRVSNKPAKWSFLPLHQDRRQRAWPCWA